MSFRIDRLNNEMRKVIADVIDNKIKAEIINIDDFFTVLFNILYFKFRNIIK